mmetsp:Transcript_2993/g.8175  ORF Transcript_2993/g.8175 Transcript_2993/m.8175 type:complete len:224 (+) Transcript_2993:308-979(+)
MMRIALLSLLAIAAWIDVRDGLHLGTHQTTPLPSSFSPSSAQHPSSPRVSQPSPASSENSRRSFLQRTPATIASCIASTMLISSPSPSCAITAPVDTTSRMVDVGGGFDLRSGKQLKTIDAVFPRSMEGTWNCERLVVSSGEMVSKPNQRGRHLAEEVGIMASSRRPNSTKSSSSHPHKSGYDDGGNRIVEGLEIMKTYRVLDGVAGTEMPTSTTKSMIRLTR